MKKTFILAVVVFIGLLGLKTALSYSSASVYNQVFLDIVPAEDGLVSLVCPDSNFTIIQGEHKDFLLLTNNLTDRLTYEITTDDSRLQLKPSSGPVWLTEKIELYVPDDYPAGDVPVTVLLTGWWPGGNAEIKATIPVRVTEKAPAGQDETAAPDGEQQEEEAPAREGDETASGRQEATESLFCTAEAEKRKDNADSDAEEEKENVEKSGEAAEPEAVVTTDENELQEVQPGTAEEPQISEPE